MTGHIVLCIIILPFTLGFLLYKYIGDFISHCWFFFLRSFLCFNQDSWSPYISHCNNRGNICLKSETAAITRSSCIYHRWSSFWPCQASFTGHSTCRPRSWRYYPSDIWNGLTLNPCFIVFTFLWTLSCTCNFAIRHKWFSLDSMLDSLHISLEILSWICNFAVGDTQSI